MLQNTRHLSTVYTSFRADVSLDVRVQQRVSEGLDSADDAKDDPVREPLSVVSGICRLERFEAGVHGPDEANKLPVMSNPKP